jgi:hypothetical protein
MNKCLVSVKRLIHVQLLRSWGRLLIGFLFMFNSFGVIRKHPFIDFTFPCTIQFSFGKTARRLSFVKNSASKHFFPFARDKRARRIKQLPPLILTENALLGASFLFFGAKINNN